MSFDFQEKKKTAKLFSVIICPYKTPLARTPKGNGKRFELAGVRVNGGKFDPDLSEGEIKLVRFSREFVLTEFE